MDIDDLEPRLALVASYSVIASDPRVQRQVDWLAGDDWIVNTVGLGKDDSPNIRRHFELAPPSKWVASKLGYAITGRFLPRKLAFRLQLLNRVPEAVRRSVENGKYDLIVLNETEFLPWLSDRRALGKSAERGHIHVDLHEAHRGDRRRDTVGAKIAAPYYRWRHSHIGHPRIDTRSVVNEPIGKMYVDEFGIEPPQPILNVPALEELAPVERKDGEIRLLFHGMPAKQRGFQEIIGAMGALPDNFTVDFMLMPRPEIHAWLQRLIGSSPARERMRIVPPSPVREIAKRINRYDLEVIYYPHVSPNLINSLPNKFFESIQARLGIVTRPDGLMGHMVQKWENGILVPGFSAENLADSLRGLTSADIQRMKQASDRVARKVNAENEGQEFLRIVSESQ